MKQDELAVEFSTWINTQPKGDNIMQTLFKFAEHVIQLDRERNPRTALNENAPTYQELFVALDEAKASDERNAWTGENKFPMHVRYQKWQKFYDLKQQCLASNPVPIQTAAQALTDTLKRELERTPLDVGQYTIKGDLEIEYEGHKGFAGFTSIQFISKDAPPRLRKLNAPAGAPFTAQQVSDKMDAICGCAGKYNCDCVSVYNKAVGDLWTEHNTALFDKDKS